MVNIDIRHSFYTHFEVQFRCINCNATIHSGAIDFPTPNIESESHAGSIEADGEYVSCPNCDKEYDINAYAGINGSGVTISDIEDEDILEFKALPPDEELYSYSTMFRLNKLYIENFKNLKQQTFDFTNHDGLTLLIGSNSSGKSNLIEAICGVFYSLYERYEWRKQRSRAIPNKFEIEYTSGDLNYNVLAETSMYQAYVKIASDKTPITTPNLPSRIVAIYSGEEDRLRQYYFDPFISRYKKLQQDGVPLMMFLNKGHWDIALLCLLYSDKRQNTGFLSSLLKDIEIKNVIFKFKPREGYGTSSAQLITRLKNAQASPTFSINQLLSNIDEYEDASSLFQNLYIAKTHKYPLLDNIEFEFIINNTEEQSTTRLSKREAVISNIGLQSLSEGQKKLILITAAMEFAGQDNTLFLLDEPDAHVHLSRKHEIIDIVKKYTHNRHVIITTHSPTLCKHIDNKDSIMMLENGAPRPVGGQIEAAIDLVGDRSAIEIFFSSKHIIFVEGKLDKLYISKAKEILAAQYSNLDFDIYPLGGVDSFKHFGLDNLQLLNGQMILCYIDRDPIKGGEKTKLQQIAESYGIMNITANDNEFVLQGGLVKIKFYPSPNDPADISVWAIEDYFEKSKIAPKYIDYIMNDRPHIENSLPTTNCGSWKNKIRKECDIKKFLEKHYKTFTADEYGRFAILLDDIQNELNS